MKLIAILLCLAALALAQNPQAPQPAGNEKSKGATVSTLAMIALSADDQKVLDALTAQIERMKPNLEAVQKQRDDAQSLLAQAEAFLAQHNQFAASRQAFLNRIAADICQCRTSEVELAPDGKSVLRKPKPEKP